MNPVRWFKDLRYATFYGLVTRAGWPVVTLGGECQWTIDDSTLDSSSKILSAGAGHDISFERELISRYGCRLVLLDPSPTGIATVQLESLPNAKLTFLPIGLASQDGDVSFQEPSDSREGSFVGGSGVEGSPRFPCRTLSTCMRELGWRQIDLLKIDIEGFEFDVLQEIIQKGLDVRQICVEFHHGRHFRHQRGETARMILALRRAGYDLVYRTLADHTFLRRDQGGRLR